LCPDGITWIRPTGESTQKLVGEDADSGRGPGGATVSQKRRRIDAGLRLTECALDIDETVGDAEETEPDSASFGCLEAKLDALGAKIE
jgi:hypothetical protein